MTGTHIWENIANVFLLLFILITYKMQFKGAVPQSSEILENILLKNTLAVYSFFLENLKITVQV